MISLIGFRIAILILSILTLSIPLVARKSYTRSIVVPFDRKIIFPVVKVYLSNGTVVTDYCKEYYYPRKKRRGIKVGGRKIRPFETDSISVNYLSGFPKDSTWIFKNIDGPISAYSFLPILDNDEFSHLQKRGDSIQPFSDSLLNYFLEEAGIKQQKNKNPREVIIALNNRSQEHTTAYTSKLTSYKKKLTQVGKVHFKGGRDTIAYVSLQMNKKETSQWLLCEYRKIKPKETDSIFISYLRGIPYDSTWLFKVIDGSISAYSPYPVRYINSFTHIQKEDGPIEPYTKEKLKEYLVGNKRAMDLFIVNPDERKHRSIREYYPYPAILEFNFKTISKQARVDSLMKRIFLERNLKEKVDMCKEVLGLDSTVNHPYIVLGDHSQKEGKSEEAYQYYIGFLRYSENTKEIERVRGKIQRLKRPIIY